MTRYLPETDPFENPVVEFDFAGELTAIDSYTVSVEAINGRSPSASSLIDGTPQISGTSVLAAIKSNVGANQIDYKIRCEATQGVTKRVRVGVLPMRRG